MSVVIRIRPSTEEKLITLGIRRAPETWDKTIRRLLDLAEGRIADELVRPVVGDEKYRYFPFTGARETKQWTTCPCGHIAQDHNREKVVSTGLSGTDAIVYGCDYCTCDRYNGREVTPPKPETTQP